jgi:regulator of nonsense transcripts 2
VTCKKEIPMDVEFMLNDTLDVSCSDLNHLGAPADNFQAMRPKTAHLRTFAEAAAAVDVLLAEQSGRVWESDSEDGGDEEGERGGADREDGDEEVCLAGQVWDMPLTHQVLNTAAPDEHEGDEDDDAEDVVVIRERSTQHDEVNEEAQSDFDREFARMLADTTDTRRGERKAAPPIFDTAVPHIRRQAEGAAVPGAAGGGKAGASAVEQERMQFSLLSKKGNKQQVSSNCPSAGVDRS